MEAAPLHGSRCALLSPACSGHLEGKDVVGSHERQARVGQVAVAHPPRRYSTTTYPVLYRSRFEVGGLYFGRLEAWATEPRMRIHT